MGGHVSKFKEGDIVGVGCLVDSCRVCECCKANLEQFCEKEATFTFNSPDKVMGGSTFGGYSDRIVVDEAFALRISDKLNLAAAAPLLCAGPGDHRDRHLDTRPLGKHSPFCHMTHL